MAKREITDAQIETWKTQHGEIYELTRDDCADMPSIDGIRFIVRKPTRHMINTMGKHAQTDLTAANQNLLLEITLTPSREELAGLFAGLPMLSISLMQGLDKITGSAANFTAKPL